MPPFAASLINISTTGAAITLPGWDLPAPAPWPTRLEHGDEISLTGLLDVPLSCWVIAVEDSTLRVRFLFDDVVRNKLRDMIGGLAPA
jgi:hypothetical protein